MMMIPRIKNEFDLLLANDGKSIITRTDEFGKTIANTNGGSFGYVDIEIINSADAKRNFELY